MSIRTTLRLATGALALFVFAACEPDSPVAPAAPDVSSASLSRGVASNPSCSSRIRSANPSIHDATTGVPAAIASSSTIPRLSAPVFGAQ